MLKSHKPAWWLKNRHLQTIFSPIFSKKINISLLREKFILRDGDFILLDWTENKFEDKDLVVLLHGLEGSSDSPYIKRLMKKLMANGFRAVCLNFRGCGKEKPNAPLKKGYHAGQTEDLNEFLDSLFANLDKQFAISLVGFSLGGNVLLKWLGENPHHTRIHASVAVSVPFDLSQAVNHLNTGFSRLYQWKLLRALKRNVLKNFQNNGLDRKQMNKINSLFTFDDKITAPMHGFLNAEDYYTQSSSKPYLKKIKTPTLIIHAMDDPFFPREAIPHALELSPSIQFEVLPWGGHVGFIQGSVPFFPKFYLEERIVRYFLDS